MPSSFHPFCGATLTHGCFGGKTLYARHAETFLTEFRHEGTGLLAVQRSQRRTDSSPSRIVTVVCDGVFQSRNHREFPKGFANFVETRLLRVSFFSLPG